MTLLAADIEAIFPGLDTFSTPVPLSECPGICLKHDPEVIFGVTRGAIWVYATDFGEYGYGEDVPSALNHLWHDIASRIKLLQRYEKNISPDLQYELQRYMELTNGNGI